MIQSDQSTRKCDCQNQTTWTRHDHERNQKKTCDHGGGGTLNLFLFAAAFHVIVVDAQGGIKPVPLLLVVHPRSKVTDKHVTHLNGDRCCACCCFYSCRPWLSPRSFDQRSFHQGHSTWVMVVMMVFCPTLLQDCHGSHSTTLRFCK